MACASFAVSIISSAGIRALAPLLLFLLFLCAVLVWSRRSRRRRKAYVLIRLAAPGARPTTRPPLLDPDSETIARNINGIIEGAGLGPTKVVLFQGIPTTDLIVETDEPEATTTRVQALLVGLPVTILNVGRPGDVRWHTKLWRHL